MVFARKRRTVGPQETALLAAIDAKLSRLAPAIHSRDDQAALVWTWIDQLLDDRYEVTSRDANLPDLRTGNGSGRD